MKSENWGNVSLWYTHQQLNVVHIYTTISFQGHQLPAYLKVPENVTVTKYVKNGPPPPFLEPVPYLQEPATEPYTEQVKLAVLIPYLFKVYFNIILASMPNFPTALIPYDLLTTQFFMHFSAVLCVLQSSPPQLSPASCHFQIRQSMLVYTPI
jgi:hypothetical protein